MDNSPSSSNLIRKPETLRIQVRPQLMRSYTTSRRTDQSRHPLSRYTLLDPLGHSGLRDPERSGQLSLRNAGEVEIFNEFHAANISNASL